MVFRKLINTVLAVLILTCFMNAQAAAQELLLKTVEPQEDVKSKPEAFFDECMKDPIVSMSEETDLAFCACAASEMKKWLDTPPELDTEDFLRPVLEDREPSANEWISDIYGPCLYVPVYDMANDRCLVEKQHIFFINRPDLLYGTCECIARGESLYFEKYAAPYLEMELSQGKEITDPITAVQRDRNYFDAKSRATNDCYIEFSNTR